jgi:hypothetical protein
LGANIGGLAGGLEAELRGYRFFDGRSKILHSKNILGTGSIPDADHPYYDLEKRINQSEVIAEMPEEMRKDIGNFNTLAPTQRGHVTGKINTRGFEGDLTLKVRFFPEEEGHTFFITKNGKQIYSTNAATRQTITIKAGNTLGWGIEGALTRAPAAGLSSRPASYILASGKWRGYNGFLFWK